MSHRRYMGCCDNNKRPRQDCLRSSSGYKGSNSHRDAGGCGTLHPEKSYSPLGKGRAVIFAGGTGNPTRLIRQPPQGWGSRLSFADGKEGDGRDRDPLSDPTPRSLNA